MLQRRLFVIIFSIVLMLLVIPTGLSQEQGTHTILSGETLFSISQRYGVDMATLAQANNITDYRSIRAGETLVIPGLVSPASGGDVANPLVAASPITHIVKSGETLGQIAVLYNLTPQQILSANNISNANLLFVGQELSIWSSDPALLDADAETLENLAAATDIPAVEIAEVAEPAEHVTVVHTVQSGEHLSQIAQTYGLSWTQLASANNIQNPDYVYAGMELQIPGANDSIAAIASEAGNTDFGLVGALVTNHPGARVGTGRELVVQLSTQMTYAYEDGVLQRSSLISSGLPATPTVQGDFAIWHKTDSQTMSGPGYYLPGVPWVMYFYSGYGFHGTYWHNNFGNPMSHGCVNMNNEDAEWFYNFASIGTPVYVFW